MNLEQIYYVGEIGAVFAVAVTLILLTVQLRQNTRQQRAGALREAIIELVHAIAQTTADEESADNFRNGLHDFNGMTPNARARFHATMLSLVARFDLVLQLHDARLLDESEFVAMQRTYISIFRSPGVQQWWGYFKPMPPESLVNHLEQAVRDSRIDIQQLDEHWPWLKAATPAPTG
jgi:hypothetical protein